MRLDYFPINEGDTVVNLGAHRGAATKFYSFRVGANGKVFSLEPEKTNYMALCHATRDMYNVYTYNMAIGEESKMGVLNLGTNKTNHSTLKTFDGGETQEVEVITWDDLMARTGITEVHVAKVDAEGAECEWLRGMTHTYPHYIVMEEHSRFAYEYKELADLLREKDYMWTGEGTHLYATR